MSNSMGQKVGLSVGLAVLLIAGLVGVLFMMNNEDENPQGNDPNQDNNNTEVVDPTTSQDEDSTSEGASDPEKEKTTSEEKEEPEKVVQKKPEGPASIEGKILNLNGEPIEKAKIFLIDSKKFEKFRDSLQGDMMGANRDPSSFLINMRKKFVEESKKLPQTESAADGSYAFYKLSTGEFRLLVLHTDHLANLDTYVIREKDEPTKQDVSLVEGYKISGVVVGEEGKPIRGAHVTAVASTSSGSKGFGKMIGFMADLFDGKIFSRLAVEKSKADGKFTVSSLEPQLYDLTVIRAGYQRKLVAKVTPGTSGLVIKLVHGLHIKGDVVDPEGKPVKGAIVKIKSFVPANAFNNPFMMSQSDFDIMGEKNQEGKTSAVGAFKFLGIEKGKYSLLVKAEGYPNFEQEGFDVKAPGFDFETIQLEEGVEISGSVVDAQGQPIEGAEVWAEELKKSGQSAFNFNAMPGKKLSETKTDEAGKFVLSGLRQGEVNVLASFKGYSPDKVKAEGGEKGIKMELLEGGSFYGQVVDSKTGDPIEGMRMMISGGGSMGGSQPETDADGYFEITGIIQPTDGDATPFGSGNFYLMGMHKEYNQIGMQVGIKGSDPDKPKVIKATRLELIDGLVTNEDGEPVSGARVGIRVPGVPEMFMAMNPASGALKAISKADGTFGLRNPGMRGMGGFGGNVFIYASHPLYATGSIRLEKDTKSVEIVLGQGNVVKGQVTDTDGNIVPGAILRLRTSVEMKGEMAMITAMFPVAAGKPYYASKDGNYVISRLEPGTYDIDVIAMGYAKKSIKKYVVDKPEQVENIVLNVGGSIKGNVVNSAGEPVSGVEMVAFLTPKSEREDTPGINRRDMEEAMMFLNAQGASQTTTNSNGEFILKNLPEGLFTVVARKRGYQQSIERDVEAGTTINDLVVDKTSAIEGVVTDARTGLPIEKFSITAYRIEEGSQNFYNVYNQTRSYNDKEGLFLYDNVEVGKYEVSARAEGYAPSYQEIDVKPGEVGSVKLVLNTGVTVNGVVVDGETGEAIPGANISYHQTFDSSDQTAKQRRRANRYFGNTNKISNEDGSFNISGLEEGEYNLYASHQDYYAEDNQNWKKVELPAQAAEEVVFKMRLGGRVEGTISDLPDTSGERMNFNVKFERQPDEEAISSKDKKKVNRHRHSQSAWINPNTGSYNAGSLRPGVYKVSIEQHIYQRVETGEGGVQHTSAEGSPKLIPLGEIEVQAGKTINFDERFRES